MIGGVKTWILAPKTRVPGQPKVRKESICPYYGWPIQPAGPTALGQTFCNEGAVWNHWY